MLKPLKDLIIMKTVEASNKSKGGLFLPDNREGESHTECVVTAVGPGLYTENGSLIGTTVKVGDKVLVTSAKLRSYEAGGEKFVYTTEDNILGIIE